MTRQQTTVARHAREAAEAADLLVTVASTLNDRLAVTADELARSQSLLKEASEELLTAFRGAADRLVAAQKLDSAERPERPEYGVVLDHLYRAVQHLQSHDLVNQLIDAQKHRVEKMRDKLAEALASQPHDARAMLDCIIAGIAQIDQDVHAPRAQSMQSGSVDLF
ncbi:MAG TPA: hypothetical protein VFP44_25360 [Usitatibacter sp.]|nr:hypothetical protein [Usitatibacter sp.]